MASKTLAIAQGNTSLALGLTGVPVQVAEDMKEVEQRVSELMDAGTTDVVILDEAYRGQFSEWFAGRLARHTGKPL